ncbi:MAG: YoaK family protein [Chloroherpetonaceae bacterium]|nr:YoaK family protein [Chloroherpetonaceae bacterium]
MFRQHGHLRTYAHNLRIASFLSFVAGSVNSIGFLAVAQLTTNVTGHFAYFVEEVFQGDVYQSAIFFLFIMSFFVGSFISNVLVEWMEKRNEKRLFVYPVIAESLILLGMAIFGDGLTKWKPNAVAIILLFAMGLQNSLVTRISNSVVRTTHLTGLFTDLGIEISQLIFYKQPEQRTRLFGSIRLRFQIIIFFLIGGLSGAFLFGHFKLLGLFLTVIVLGIGLIYDVLTIKMFFWAKRKLTSTGVIKEQRVKIK